jgi:hypothetical protein
MGGASSTYGGKGEGHIGFWKVDLREGDHLGRYRCRWEDIIKVVGWEHGLD